MSFFWGLLSFKNEPIQNNLQQMQESLQNYQCKSEKLWIKNEIGFGFKKRIFTASSAFDNSPYTENNCTIVSHSRLDNRAELLNLLNFPLNLHSITPDTVLILKAYFLWGSFAANKLKGDWSFAIWDNNTMQLILAVDHLSCNGIYYLKNSSSFVFANNKKPILAIKEDPYSLNHTFVLRTLLLMGNNNPQTTQKDIYFVPPGHVVTVTHNGNFNKRRYWFPTRVETINYKNKQDYIAHFYHLYKIAVEKRLPENCKIGSHLSGGLDSGSVSWLAAEILKERNQSLTAFTSSAYYKTPISNTHFANEDYYASLTAKSAGNIHHEIIDSKNVSVFDSLFKSKEIFNELFHGAGNTYWLMSIHERAKSLGIPIILNAQIGNASVSWCGSSSKSFFSDIYKIKSNFFNAVKAGFETRDMHYLKWRLFTNMRIHLDDYSFFKWEELRFFSLKDINYRHKDELDSEPFNLLKKKQLELLRPRQSPIGLFWQLIGQEYNQQCWDPTNDIDLVEFCLAIPQDTYNANGGRNLIKTGFKGKLPEEILQNKLIGIQAADIEERFNIDSKKIEEYLFDNLKNNFQEFPYINWDSIYKNIYKKNSGISDFHLPNLILLYKLVFCSILLKK